MKYILVKKAYQIDFNKIEEGYLYCERSCYAKTRNEAKSTLLGKLKSDYEELQLKYSDDKVNYLNIPVIRYKEADRYLFEDKELTLSAIEEIHQERIRIASLDEILNDNSIVFCYIKKGNYYKPGSSGYTDFKIFAGVYTKEEAISHAKSVREIKIIPINIDEHNSMIVKEIEDLKSRYILQFQNN